jgi:hypothetical protein
VGIFQIIENYTVHSYFLENNLVIKGPASNLEARPLQDQKTACEMMVTVDLSSYSRYEDYMRISQETMSVFHDVNAIYKSSFGIDVRLSTIFVLTSKTDRTNLTGKFPSMSNGLERLRKYVAKSNARYCQVVHVSPYDYGGMLGLAWVGDGKGRGVCSKGGYNTAIVTFKNHGKDLDRHRIVGTYAHELGHAFGSDHDTSNCGNDFLMDPTIQEGPNSHKFSTCSQEQIRQVIQNATCLKHTDVFDPYGTDSTVNITMNVSNDSNSKSQDLVPSKLMILAAVLINLIYS